MTIAPGEIISSADVLAINETAINASVTANTALAVARTGGQILSSPQVLIGTIILPTFSNLIIVGPVTIAIGSSLIIPISSNLRIL